MPRVLKHIDQIGREKNRDVLFVQFDKKVFPKYDYKNYNNRAELLTWLDDNNIAYEECFGVASDNGFESYRGQLYIDVVFDETLDKYNLLNTHIEPQDGVLRFEGIGLWTLPLSIAVKNAYMDDPDYESTLFS